MTQTQIDTIKSTWIRLIAFSENFGQVFYPKLFAYYPELETLFKERQETQGKKLFMLVALVVTKIDKLDQLKEEVFNLAKRHITYQVRPEYFAMFGRVFIEGIDEMLKKPKQEVLDAWKLLYDTVSEAMIEDMKSVKNFDE